MKCYRRRAYGSMECVKILCPFLLKWVKIHTNKMYIWLQYLYYVRVLLAVFIFIILFLYIYYINCCHLN